MVFLPLSFEDEEYKCSYSRSLGASVIFANFVRLCSLNWRSGIALTIFADLGWLCWCLFLLSCVFPMDLTPRVRRVTYNPPADVGPHFMVHSPGANSCVIRLCVWFEVSLGTHVITFHLFSPCASLFRLRSGNLFILMDPNVSHCCSSCYIVS